MHRAASRWLAAALPALALCGAHPAAASAGGPADAYVTYAEVVAVTPRYGWTEVREPVRQCEDVAYRSGRPPHDYHRFDDGYYEDRRPRRHRDGGGNAAAGLVGGLIGGLVGNQFGGGDGRKALTVVGALVGASVAQDHARRRSDERHRYYDSGRRHGRHDAYRVVRRCTESVDHRQVRGVQGYDVTYRYQGRTFNKWMDQHPGDRVRIHVEVEPADELAGR